ncbi:8604_t:CDS:2, partial [Gigaspora rosea]
GKWFAQLATQKQQLNEDVDTYYTAIQELLRQIVLAVAPSTPNTLQAAYERAKEEDYLTALEGSLKSCDDLEVALETPPISNSPFMPTTPVSSFYPIENKTNKDDSYDTDTIQTGEKCKECHFNENDSDADSIIDETRRQLKLEKEEFKIATPDQYDSIVDIFDYYYGEQVLPKDTYNIGNLEGEQYTRLHSFLEENSTIFAWEGKKLGRTSFIKHRIDTGNALPIKHNPYCHSPAEKEIIKIELTKMLKE